jgi:CIC family chloride channel protein
MQRNIFHRLNTLRPDKIDQQRLIIILSLIIGLASGLAAVMLKNIVHFTNYHITKDFHFEKENFLYLALPLIGLFLTVLYVKYSVKDDIGHGVSKILYSISKKHGNIKKHNTFSSIIASTLTVAFGGSVGLEAPIVLTGSAIGSNLGRVFHLGHRPLMILIGAGAAGAISGIFKAPIAAVVFAIEVLMLDLTITALIPLLISAVAGATVAFFLSGKGVLFSFHLIEPFQLNDIPLFILLGLFTGLVSVYFTKTTIFIESQFRRIGNAYTKVLIGGISLGILIFVFPPLFGEGYEALQEILIGEGKDLINEGLFFSLKDKAWFFGLIVFMFFMFKAVASAITTGSGGVGGIFAPSLFIGGFAGDFLAMIINLFPFIQVSESNFALVGMAGVMSGVMFAPLTGIFLIAEITGGYQLLTPLIITSTISFLTIKYFIPHSIYSKRLAERGELMTHHKDKAMLSLMMVGDMIETDFTQVDVNSTLGDFVKAVPKSKRNVFPIVDSENIFYGVIFINEIRDIIFEQKLYDKTFVRDLMFMPRYIVSPDDSMENVAQKFSESDKYNVPVIKNGKYLGFISRATVFSNYRKLLREFSEE